MTLRFSGCECNSHHQNSVYVGDVEQASKCMMIHYFYSINIEKNAYLSGNMRMIGLNFYIELITAYVGIPMDECGSFKPAFFGYSLT